MGGENMEEIIETNKVFDSGLKVKLNPLRVF